MLPNFFGDICCENDKKFYRPETGDSGKEHTGESLQQAAPVFHQAGSFQGGILLL